MLHLVFLSVLQGCVLILPFYLQPWFYPVLKYCFTAICFTCFIFVNSVIVSSNISCNNLSWDFIVMYVWYFVCWNSISVLGAIWPSLSPCTVINPILLTYWNPMTLMAASKTRVIWNRGSLLREIGPASSGWETATIIPTRGSRHAPLIHGAAWRRAQSRTHEMIARALCARPAITMVCSRKTAWVGAVMGDLHLFKGLCHCTDNSGL